MADPCTVCDRELAPDLNPWLEAPWDGRLKASVTTGQCARHLDIGGGHSTRAADDCREHAVNWRQRALESERKAGGGGAVAPREQRFGCVGTGIDANDTAPRAFVLIPPDECTADEVWKHCLRCAQVISLLQKRMKSYTTEILDLDCGEIWDDAPPKVAKLAFWLPADEVPL